MTAVTKVDGNGTAEQIKTGSGSAQTGTGGSEMADKNFVSKAVIDLVKWMIGTIGLGIAGIVINRQIQKNELDIKRMEADTQLLAVITKDVTHHSSSDTLELRYLSFIRTFITTDSIKHALENRRLELDGIIQSRGRAQASNSIQDQQKKAHEKIDEPMKQQLNKIDATLRNRSAEVSINDFKAEENKIAETVSSIDSTAIVTLNASQKAITPSVVKDKEISYTLLGDPLTKWCKAGYYVEFSNTIRVSVSKVTPGSNTITVDLKDISVSNDHPPFIRENVNIASGETILVDHGNYRYQIKLNYIGAAGKNPFTKAGYITVATYRKA